MEQHTDGGIGHSYGGASARYASPPVARAWTTRPARPLRPASASPVLAPQLAGHLEHGLVHPGQHSTATLGGLDGTVASCLDQPRRAQPVKVTARLPGVAVAVDRGNPSRRDRAGSQSRAQLGDIRTAPAGAPPGAGTPAARETDILPAANVSRSSTGAISGAYQFGGRSAKSAASRPYQPAANRPDRFSPHPLRLLVDLP